MSSKLPNDLIEIFDREISKAREELRDEQRAAREAEKKAREQLGEKPTPPEDEEEFGVTTEDIVARVLPRVREISAASYEKLLTRVLTNRVPAVFKLHNTVLVLQRPEQMLLPGFANLPALFNVPPPPPAKGQKAGQPKWAEDVDMIAAQMHRTREHVDADIAGRTRAAQPIRAADDLLKALNTPDHVRVLDVLRRKKPKG